MKKEDEYTGNVGSIYMKYITFCICLPRYPHSNIILFDIFTNVLSLKFAVVKRQTKPFKKQIILFCKEHDFLCQKRESKKIYIMAENVKNARSVQFHTESSR